MAGNIFNAPTGTPARKPSNVKQYPDFPEIGGMKSGAMPKNSMSLERKAGMSGGRSAPGTK
jgi:hypothetical protein